jgi:hypothetical protein
VLTEKKLYMQFQARRVLTLLAVVEAKRKTPTRAVAMPRTPRRPARVSVRRPPMIAPGTPRDAMISMFRYVVYVVLVCFSKSALRRGLFSWI